jgi:predicted nucleotidyltransferase component of viral defense system
MSGKEMNVVASVLARLHNHSKSSGAPFQQVLQQYAIERFLYRISKSKHAQSVILKGALLLKTIGIPRARPTMDIDMLRKGKADQTSLLALVKDCAILEVEADGLTFLANSAVAEEITKDSEYKGTRILMDARMDNVRLRIQIHFGVGDVMVPGPRMVEYPVFLGNDTIQLLAYPVESAIAEKLQAMVALGTANSRMKDFYDVWIYLSSRLQHAHASQGGRRYVQESGNTLCGRRIRGPHDKSCWSTSCSLERLREKDG